MSPTLPLEAASEGQSAFPTLLLTVVAWPHHVEPNLATMLVAGYVDYETFGRDLFIDGYFSVPSSDHGVHVFHG